MAIAHHRRAGAEIRRVKLQPPPIAADAITRPRLEARLDAARSATVVCLVAPGGAGKSTLVRQWLARRGSPVAWLRLDDGDNELERLVVHLVAALQPIAPGAGRSLLAELGRPNQAPVRDLAAMLASDLLDCAVPFSLVLDDLETLVAAHPLAFLGALARDLATPGRIVLASRSEPDIGLAPLRLAGRVCDLRAADLAFTHDEARALFGALAPDLPADALDLATSSLGGWAAGLRFAALAPTRDTRSPLPPADSDQAAFLLDIVLHRLPDRDRDDLLRLAILERIAPDLARALLDLPSERAARQTLDRLRRQGLFLPTTDEPWRVLLPRVRDAVLDVLPARIDPDEVRLLHLRAATWFAHATLVDEAIVHGLAAGADDLVRDLVLREVDAAIDRERWTGPARWLARLPAAMIEREPALQLAAVYCAAMSANIPGVIGLAGRARAAVLASGWTPHAIAAACAELDVLVATWTTVAERDPVASLAVVDAAPARVPQTRPYPVGQAIATRALVLASAGHGDEAIAWLARERRQRAWHIDAATTRILAVTSLVHIHCGQFRAALAVANDLVPLAAAHDLGLSLAWGHMLGGIAALALDEHAIGIDHLSRLARANKEAHLLVLREGLIALAVGFDATGARIDADATLDRLGELLAVRGFPAQDGVIGAARALLALRRHGPDDRVLGWLREPAPPLDYLSIRSSVAHPWVVRAEALLACGGDGRIAEAGTMLDALEERVATAHFDALAPVLAFLRARHHRARGDESAALVAARRGLRLADAQESRRFLREAASPLHDLFAAIAAGETDDAPLARAALAAASAPTPRQAVATTPLATLSRRELQVLDGLAAGLTDKDLAAQLFISPATVRKHLTSLHRKLGAHGRQDAVRIASAAGWRPRTSP